MSDDTAPEIIAYDRARLEIDGPLATFWFDDPDKLNALSAGMVEALYAAIIEIAKPRRRIRCLMITGEGRAFSAGANLSSGAARAERTRAEPPVIQSVAGVFHPLLRRIRDLEIPLVVAVNGPCVGFGFAITLLADYVIASDKAFFLVPFATLASCTDSGITWLLPRAIGTARARAMIMRAERLPADRALDWGMINRVVPQDDLRAESRKIADEFASGPTVALGIMRQLFQHGPELTLDQHLELENRGVARTARTRDNTIAIMNFGRKEKPAFAGE
ncbi:MAG: enoyl-CoA hydratase/isomerase family protein [Bradyrhizobium sp.]|nr:enoyl-CoA hydratase/isomerase family protein [Bradyrhizobium sp.]